MEEELQQLKAQALERAQGEARAFLLGVASLAHRAHSSPSAPLQQQVQGREEEKAQAQAQTLKHGQMQALGDGQGGEVQVIDQAVAKAQSQAQSQDQGQAARDGEEASKEWVQWVEQNAGQEDEKQRWLAWLMTDPPPLAPPEPTCPSHCRGTVGGIVVVLLLANK